MTSGSLMYKQIPILLGLVLVTFAVWLQITTVGSMQHFITRLENLAYDLQLRTKLLTHPKVITSSVVIVDVDDKSIQAEGRWPWSRAKLALLTARLHEAGATVIVWDMFFAAHENNIATEMTNVLKQNHFNLIDEALLKKIEPLFDRDEFFAKELKKTDSVLGMSFKLEKMQSGSLPPPILTLKENEQGLDLIKAEGYISNIPILQNAVKSTGFVNVFGSEDGIIRDVPLVIRYEKGIYPSLALAAVSLYLLRDVELVTASYADEIKLEGVKLANHIIPTDEQGQVIIPFRGKSFTFPYYSAVDVLNKKIPPDVLLGKIVFVGTSATGLGDIKPTAIERSFPGVEIQATIADGILTDNFSYKPAWAEGVEVFLTIVLGLIFAFVFPYLGPRVLALIMLIFPAGMFFINNWIWDRTGLIISIFIPILLLLFLAVLNIIYGYLFETRRREHLKEMFGQYVPAKHIDEMLTTTSANAYGLYGEDRQMTVLFADIRNFTTISEGLSATQLKEMLSDFFTPMTEIIFKHHGTIDKYVGDLIMAFWGAPLKDKRHAEHAVLAAIEMQEKIASLRPTLKEQGWPELNIGIGLNSGVMSVGDMGSKFRRNYTVLGDAVNLASRIESLTKYYGVGIIVTGACKDETKGFVFRQLDRVQVKGKTESIAIFEVVGRKSNLTLQKQQEIEKSDLALKNYFERNWEEALRIFSALNQEYPETLIYKLYIDRIKKFLIEPPKDNWNGVFVLTEK